MEIPEHLKNEWDAMSDQGKRVILTMHQALADLGIPVHPGGICPETPCPCAGVSGAAIEARAREIMARQ